MKKEEWLMRLMERDRCNAGCVMLMADAHQGFPGNSREWTKKRSIS